MSTKFPNFNWPTGTPRTNAEFEKYPQFSNDHFRYRMVRITHAWRLEEENAKLREALTQIANAHGNDETTARYCKGLAREALKL